jgi:lipoprotein NlpI
MKQEIAEHPRYPDLHNHLGVAYLIQCRNLFLRALDEFRRAIRLNPNYRQAQKNLKLAENEGKGLFILLRALLK